MFGTKSMCHCAGEGMFGEKQNYFKNGRIDQAALVSFIKDIKKNTSLSDEDAATLAASKVTYYSMNRIIENLCWSN